MTAAPDRNTRDAPAEAGAATLALTPARAVQLKGPMTNADFQRLKPGARIHHRYDPKIVATVVKRTSYGFQLRMDPPWPTRHGRAIDPRVWERVLPTSLDIWE